MVKRFIFFLVWNALCMGNMVWAQYFPAKNYPQNYFQWPVGAKVAIVANFGELRPNHFHMGLDCRTEQVVNKPVYAAAAGYIAKVKIEPWGFGRALYVNHPNGLTTLYAHLNEFYPALEAYIKQYQYETEKWAISIDLPAGLFAVSKGMFIAKSGSTGGSQGPHVHFEIRDTKTDKVLNPLLMNMPIADNIPPQIIRLAVYDRNISTYEQTPKVFTLRSVNGVYTVPGGKLSLAADKVSFAVTAFDRYTGSTNQNGIYEAVMFDNEKRIGGFQLDSIGYDETRYLNGHIDYRYKASGGPYLQHISRLPGMSRSIYSMDATDGIVALSPGETHKIKIAIKDANNNQSTIQFDMLSTGAGSSTGDAGILFEPGNVNVFENENVKFYLPENALYDYFHFKYAVAKDASGQPVYQLHNATVPVHTYFNVQLQANLSPSLRSKAVIYRFYGTKKDYVAATYANGWYKAAFREFGNFQLLVDSTAPVLSPVGFYNGINATKLSRIVFKVKDDTEEIADFRAKLDGNWLRFTNDKGSNFVYYFDEKCPPGDHVLEVTVTDQVGNSTNKTYNFKR